MQCHFIKCKYQTDYFLENDFQVREPFLVVRFDTLSNRTTQNDLGASVFMKKGK